MIISRAIYGLKIFGAAWMWKLAENFILLISKSSEEDADVWTNRDFKPNGYPYYK